MSVASDAEGCRGDALLEAEIDGAQMATLQAVAQSPEAKAFVAHIAAMIDARDRDCGQRRRTTKAMAGLERAVGALTGDLLRACDSGGRPGMVYRTRHSNSFSGGPFGFDTFSTAVNGGAALGLLEVFAGCDLWREFDWGDDGKTKTHRGKAARFRPTPALIASAASMGVRLDQLRRHFYRPAPERVVVLKSGANWERGTKYEGHLLKFEETPKLDAVRAEVRAINEFLLGVRIDGANHDGFFRGFSMGDAPDFDWNKGGRLYSYGRDHFQQIKKARRAEITLDGEAVAEIDVRASYLTILHGITGTAMNVNQDPYGIPGVPRDIAKRWLTATLGSGKVLIKWPSKMAQGYLATTGQTLGRDFRAARVAEAMPADSDDAAMSFRDHAASYSGMIPPPLGGAFRPCDLDGFSGSGQA